MPIKMKLNLDDSAAKAALAKFRRDAGKPVKSAAEVGGGQSYADASRERQRKRAEDQRRKEIFQKGQGAAQQAQSGEEEYLRGGFYNSLKDKIDSVKKVREMFQKKKPDDENARGENDGIAEAVGRVPWGKGSLSSKRAGSENRPIQRLVVQNAVFRNVRGMGHGNSMMGGGGGGESGPGGLTSAMGKAAPYIGIVFAIAGGIMKAISSIGEKYTSVQMSQIASSRAIGFTQYRGGLYDHSEVGQANLEYIKQSGRNKSTRIANQDISFAASQGMGAAEYAGLLGQIRYGGSNMETSEFARYMKSANVLNLRQGEYMKEIASHTKEMRDSGFGTMDDTEMRSFLGLAAQMSNTQSRNGSTADRGLEIAKKLDNSVRQADKGGPLGQIALSQMMAGGKDYFTALRELEQKGLSGDGARNGLAAFFKNMDPNIKGYLMREYGMSSFSEGRNVQFGLAKPASRAENITGIENQALALKNQTDMMYGTSSFGLKSAQIGYDAQKFMMQMMENNAGALTAVAEGVHQTELALFDFTAKAVNGMSELVTTIKDVGEKLKNLKMPDLNPFD